MFLGTRATTLEWRGDSGVEKDPGSLGFARDDTKMDTKVWNETKEGFLGFARDDTKMDTKIERAKAKNTTASCVNADFPGRPAAVSGRAGSTQVERSLWSDGGQALRFRKPRLTLERIHPLGQRIDLGVLLLERVDLLPQIRNLSVLLLCLLRQHLYFVDE